MSPAGIVPTRLRCGSWFRGGGARLCTYCGKVSISLGGGCSGHALVEAGRRVTYTRTTEMVQRLQAARRDLALEAALARLEKLLCFGVQF